MILPSFSLSIAQSHGTRVSGLVAQLFYLSKLDSGDVSLHCERFSLLEVAHAALQYIGTRAQVRHVKSHVVAQESSNIAYAVMADISLIHCVFEP